MTYTYEEFLNAANSNGVMDKFSQKDLTVAQKNPEYGLSMVSLMKDISGATTAEQRLLATEAANQLRKNYGVYDSGGGYASSYGSQINNLMNQVNNYGSFQYSGQDQLQQTMDKVNNYGSFQYSNQDQLQQTMDKVNNYGSFSYGNENAYQQLLNSILNQEAFQYDAAQDPSFSAYKKAYLREGERASANALAQASAGSGGQVSSYAAQAAQQANNYYAGQLADIIPTLEQNAYQKYLGDISNRMSSLSALQSDRSQAQQNWQSEYAILQNALANLQSDRSQEQQNWQSEYAILQNALANLQTDRANAQQDWQNGYNLLAGALGNLQQQDATDYQRYLSQLEMDMAQQQYADALAQQKYQDELAAQQYADAMAQQQYENALALYKQLGYATPEIAQILGITAATVEETPAQTGPQTGPTGPETGDVGDQGDDATIQELKNQYPSGIVSDATTWNGLVSMYGEDLLAKAGIRYQEQQPKPVVNNGGKGGGAGKFGTPQVRN